MPKKSRWECHTSAAFMNLAIWQVERAATVLLRDPEGEQRLVAYVSPAEVDVKELESKLRDHVPSNLIPYLFQTMRRLPTTSHGEVSQPPVSGHSA